MTEDEKSAHAIYRSRLSNDLCTPAEKEDAKHQIEVLEHRGTMGAALEMVAAFEERLSAIELIKGRGKAAFTKAMFEELKADVETVKASLKAGDQVCELLAASITTNKHEINGLWADRRKDIEGGKIAAATLTSIQRDIASVREQTSLKFTELDAQDTKILKALGDIIADAVDEAKTAIMAEARSAAIDAITSIVGDSTGKDDEQDPLDHLA